MTLRRSAGIVLVSLGLIGYVAGIYAAYPGRALSLTAVMVGTALIGVASSSTGAESV